MEAEPLYEGVEEEQIKRLKTPGIQAELDKHCALMVSAESIQNLLTVHMAAANGWLNNVQFPVASYEHDHGLIISILHSIAHRRMICLQLRHFTPEIQKEMQRICATINFAGSTDEISKIVADGKEWADEVTVDSPAKNLALKSMLDMAASRSFAALLFSGIRTGGSSNTASEKSDNI